VSQPVAEPSTTARKTVGVTPPDGNVLSRHALLAAKKKVPPRWQELHAVVGRPSAGVMYTTATRRVLSARILP
jgi:hypothetical protein